ncbi:hypothetical protein I601_2630 [Nocardioides dokdonensis FR1436]|uniref:Uncharacterized protein n=1 Tax=Nocardioides dokdonensis FR1436 TaxID=1300347 RepID=A0A1A9GLS5_9ACTN|nr:hypothetical protein [Nocardioides dokdonensis]ANH39046.1 hypothetical protein I601_2630 [Nocardioides dokdonensis FR1436]
MLGPLPRRHRSFVFSLLVLLGAAGGLVVVMAAPALPATVGLVAGAGAGALLALAADGSRPVARQVRVRR